MFPQVEEDFPFFDQLREKTTGNYIKYSTYLAKL